jgi:NitT/TauT family transport system ATP-binding protein
MLDVQKLYHQYGPHAVAIEDISFQVKQGELVAVVGPSGCGKSTLLKALAGLMRHSGGVIRLHDRIVRDVPEGLAMVFQDYGRSLYPWMRVGANVELPLRYQPVSHDERIKRVAESLQAVGLAHAADLYPWQLSGGMQQRVAIARALAYRPVLLLMDEPFASVDAQTRAELEDLLIYVRDLFKITIVVVTHDIDEAVYLSDRVIVLSKAPSHVLAEVAVELPRKRDQIATKALDLFIALRSQIATLIRGTEQRRQAISDSTLSGST